jgi:hypothetical protein
MVVEATTPEQKQKTPRIFWEFSLTWNSHIEGV